MIPHLSLHLQTLAHPTQPFVQVASHPDGTPFMRYSPELQALIQDLEKSSLVREFDWSARTQTYAEQLRRPERLRTLTQEEVSELVTYLVRQERTSEGLIGSLAEKGAILTLLRRIHTLSQPSKKHPLVLRIVGASVLLLFGMLLAIYIPSLVQKDVENWFDYPAVNSVEELYGQEVGTRVLVRGVLSTTKPHAPGVPFDVAQKYILRYDPTYTSHYNRVPTTWSLEQIVFPDTRITTSTGSIALNTKTVQFWNPRSQTQTLEGIPTDLEIMDQTVRWDGFISGDQVAVVGIVQEQGEERLVEVYAIHMHDLSTSQTRIQQPLKIIQAIGWVMVLLAILAMYWPFRQKSLDKRGEIR